MPELIKSTYAIGTEYLLQETEENQIGLKPFNPIAIPVSQNLLFKAILVVSSNVDPSYTNIEGGISGTISTLNIEPTLGNGFNLFAGDKVLLKTTIEDIYELTLTANFVYGVNTSISFVPFISYSTIENGSIILASQSDQFNEGNRKTRGQVAGFTISPSTITKNGIGISSWFNDPTFNEATHTTLPTSQAVKEYVLAQGGGSGLSNFSHTWIGTISSESANNNAFIFDNQLGIRNQHRIDLGLPIIDPLSIDNFQAVNSATYIANKNVETIKKWTGKISTNDGEGTFAIYHLRSMCQRGEALMSLIERYRFSSRGPGVLCFEIPLDFEIAEGDLIIPVFSLRFGGQLTSYICNIQIQQ